MKSIRVEIPESLYTDYDDYARRRNLKTEDVIHMALQLHRARLRKGTHSLRDQQPVSMGRILKPWSSRAQLLEDFFDREDDHDRD